MGMWEAIKAVFRKIWEVLMALGKIIADKILSFKNNIVAFFKDKSRLALLRKHRELLAVTIKENLENGNFNTVSCLFNQKTSEVEQYEQHAQGYETEELDRETQEKFAGTDMMVLQ